MSATKIRLTPDSTAWRTLLTLPVANDVVACSAEFSAHASDDDRPLLLRAAEAVEMAFETMCSPNIERRTAARRIVGIVVRAGLEDAILCVEPIA